jgi:hypothetical protein
MLAAGLAFGGGAPALGQSVATTLREGAAVRIEAARPSVQARRGGVLGLMGYNMVPDGSTNALQIETTSAREDGEADPSLTLGQIGFGFTVSEAVPIFLEWYLGYARYDPRVVFDGESPRRSPLRWNNVTTTIGIGYDIRLTDTLWLRPVINGAVGYAASDASLFASFLQWRRGVELPGLEDAHANVWARGGSLMLAYYDFQPERDIDIELRYTHLLLETFGDTTEAARGRSTAQTLGLWARYRWPTGWEAFGRPVRWVLDSSVTTYFGDQRETLGFAWAVKAGGGIEFDTGRWELGAFGVNLNRVRLIGRYFYGDGNTTGYSFGIGMTF